MRGNVVRSVIPGRRRIVPVRCAMITLLMSLAAASALAQGDSDRDDIDSPGLRIEAATGWDGVVNMSAPVPVAFLIHNDSEQPIEGRLLLSDLISEHNSSLGKVVISPGTSRRVTSIQAMTNWTECIATFSSDAGVLWRRELPLHTGIVSGSGENVALFIDDGGRRLHLSVSAENQAESDNAQTSAVGQGPGFIQCLTAATWQLPNHPGPLLPVQAVIFPEKVADEAINDVQWQALARWVCQGGVVFAHRDSENVLQRLLAVAPLSAEPADRRGEFNVRRVGLGAIYQFDAPLLPSAGAAMRDAVARAIASLPRPQIASILAGTDQHYWRGGKADRNRAFVAMFFAGYTVLVGIIPLVLFRLSRKQIATYAIVVVGGACLGSGIAGGYLRSSRGDLKWTTVTQPGAGGAVQVARLDVQSAGGRNTRVAVQGADVDLQFTGTTRRYYWYQQRPQNAFPPFTWQPDLAPGVENCYQAQVTMTPWGRRQLHAAAFQPGMPALDFELEYEPRDLDDSVEASQVGGDYRGDEFAVAVRPHGVFRVKVVNNLPITLTDVWLVVMANQSVRLAHDPAQANTVSPLQARLPDLQMQGGAILQITAPGDAELQMTQKMPLSSIAAGAVHESSFEAAFTQRQEQDWDQMIQTQNGYIVPPQLDRRDAASAWIIARLDHSPVMAIDAGLSEFDPQEELHLFVQEILPEDMPTISLAPEQQESTPDAADPEVSGE